MPDKADNLLNNVRIASPCTVDWDKMTGDERTRFCHECKLNVHNLSAMTATEAENLLKGKREGQRLCVSFYRRADGTVLTQDCPVGIKLLQMKAKRAWNKVASFVSLFMCIGLSAQADPDKTNFSGSNCAAKITVHDSSLKAGIELCDRGEYLKALKFFRDACDKNPKNDEARYYFGLTLQTARQNDAALKQYKILTESSTASSEVRAAAQENIRAISTFLNPPQPQRTMGMIAPRRIPSNATPTKPDQPLMMIKGDYIQPEIGKVAK